MSALVPLPVVLPLGGAALSILVGRHRAAQRLVSLSVLAATLVISVVLLVRADRDGFVAHDAGGWSADLGIVLVVDRLAGLMLVVSSLALFAVMVFAVGEADEEQQRVGFHPVYLVLAAGVGASFVTADLFNLFVAFEMMLAASYVLITLGGRPDQVRSGMSYVVISLVASTLFITVLALLYAATGTVNMADLAERIPQLSTGVRTGFSLLLILVFGIMWFFLIRPQQKKLKDDEKMRSALRRGDKVLTSGGIVGKVTKVKEDGEIEVEIAPSVKIHVVKGAITQVMSKTEPAEG